MGRQRGGPSRTGRAFLPMFVFHGRDGLRAVRRIICPVNKEKIGTARRPSLPGMNLVKNGPSEMSPKPDPVDRLSNRVQERSALCESVAATTGSWSLLPTAFHDSSDCISRESEKKQLAERDCRWPLGRCSVGDLYPNRTGVARSRCFRDLC